MNNILKIPAFQRKKAIPKQLNDLELLPLNEEFSKLTMSIVGDDDLRPILSCNYFDMEKRKIASTDAHKLTAINMPNETFNYISNNYKEQLQKEPKGLIFHTISQLQKDYNSLMKNNNISISFNQFVKDREIQDGKYPNYEAVIPKEFVAELNVDYQKLYWYAKVLVDAKVIDDINKIDSSNKIVYENKKIEYLKDSYMSFLNPVTHQIILTYTLDGKKEFIGFNAKFLCEILKFAMQFNGKSFGKVGVNATGKAMVIELENGLNVSTDSIGLIMPVLLNRGEATNTIGNDGSPLDEIKTYEMYYDLDTNSIISDNENYPIDSSIGFMPNKAGGSIPKIQAMQQAPKVENNSEDLIDKKIRGLKIALKVAIKGEEKLIEKRILALEIAKKMSNPKVSVSEKMSKLDNNKIKDWYIKNYPTDDEKNKLDDKNTFEDLWNGLGKNKDIYEVIGIGDSLIRERLFGHLAELKGVDYDVVYNKWLDKSEDIGSVLNKVQLLKIKNKYFENEDINNHSENILLLAENFGTNNDIYEAKQIVKQHDKDGHLTSENGKKRRELSERLILKARKIMAEKGVKFAKGGSIGFKGLSNKVASRYEGKKVPQRFQSIYGKTYSQSEAKEVGNKVAGKVYREQRANKMEDGGSVDGGDYVREELNFSDKMEYAKGGYTRPSYKINTTGFFSFKTKDKEYIVRSSFFERKNDTEDLLEIQDELRGELGSIIISNSAWKRLSDGNTIKARSNKGNLTGTLTRLANLDENYNLNKMAKGGILENAQTCFTINNDYYGNLELGFYDVEFKNEKGTSRSSKSFFKLNDAFEKLFEYIKSENGQYIIEKDPKSNFYIEESFYDGKSIDNDGFPEIKYKTIFKISSKKINNLMNSNNFKDGGMIKGGKVLASSSTKEGIIKLIGQYLYGSTITLVETDNDKIFEVHNKKGKTSFYVEFSRGKYRFIQPSMFANGGEVNSSTQKLIEELKKNSNERVSDVMTNKQGEKYRFRYWKLKYNSASNFLVKLFEKASEENTGKSYNKNFYNGNYSFYYNRPEMKNKPNGSMQMRMLEVLNTFKDGGSVDSADSNNLVNIDIYKLAEEMSEKDFRNKFLTLSKSEKDNVESLIRLGDDKKLALITILDKRNESNNDDFYRQAYHYKKGGSVDKKVYIDLFEDYENIPANVQMILDEYSESFEDGDYIGMSKAQDELEQIGYTFNFYVDGDAYGLRPIDVKLSQLKGYEDSDE